jgi:peroxiredoxin
MTVRARSLALAFLIGCGTARAAAPVAIGEVVPGFRIKSLTGTEVDFDADKRTHHAVVVLFLSTVCPYAQYFGEHIRKLSVEYEPRGVLFLGIDSNAFESASDFSENARRHNYSFPQIMDQGNRVADLFGARRTPEAFVVDQEGRLRYHGWVKSKIGSPDLRDALDAVLAGERVRKPETLAFGCTIDRER